MLAIVVAVLAGLAAPALAISNGLAFATCI